MLKGFFFYVFLMHLAPQARCPIITTYARGIDRQHYMFDDQPSFTLNTQISCSSSAEQCNILSLPDKRQDFTSVKLAKQPSNIHTHRHSSDDSLITFQSGHDCEGVFSLLG